MLTVTEDRNNIVVDDSSVVRRLKAVHASCRGDHYGMVAPGCFNVEHVTWCQRQIVSNAVSPGSYVPSSGEIARSAMNSHVRDMWIRRFNRIHGFKTSLVGYHAVDNTMNLYGFIDCVLNTSELVSVVVFRYASSTSMKKIRERGPYKMDAVTAVMEAHMMCLLDSIIVYGHGSDAEFFHVRKVGTVVDSVREKCRKMASFLFTGELPAQCRSKMCRFCHPKEETPSE